jgi:hypothetical protein
VHTTGRYPVVQFSSNKKPFMAFGNVPTRDIGFPDPVTPKRPAGYPVAVRRPTAECLTSCQAPWPKHASGIPHRRVSVGNLYIQIPTQWK